MFQVFDLGAIWARDTNKQKIIIIIYKNFFWTCIESKNQHKHSNLNLSEIAVLPHLVLQHFRKIFPEL